MTVSTVKEKLAAIRAKRLGIHAVPKPLKEVPNDDDEPLPSPTKTTTVIRTPTKSSAPHPLSNSSPSPASKLRRRFRHDSRANRLLWRQKEISRIRNQTVRSIMDSDNYMYMTAKVPDEKPDIVQVKREHSDSADGASDCHDYERDNEEAEDEDEEEGDDDAGADGEDYEERALRTAAQEEDLVQSEAEEENKNVQEDETKESIGDQDNDVLKDSKYTSEKSKSEEEERLVIEKNTEKEAASESVEAKESKKSSFKIINSDDAEQLSKQIDTVESTEEEEDENAKKRLPISDTMPVRDSQSDAECEDPNSANTRKKNPNLDSDSEEEHVDETPKRKRIKQFEEESSFAADNAMGLFESEAQEDGDGEDDQGDHPVDRYSEDEDGGSDDENDNVIVPDTSQKKSEKINMANFHRQWELQKEREDIKFAASGTGVRCLLNTEDEAGDLEQTGTSNEKDAKCISGSSDDPQTKNKKDGENGDTNSEVDEKDAKDEKQAPKKDASTEYMEAMFRLDNTMSNVNDNDIHASGDPARREQQKLLWKARQKFKTQIHESNDDSLCHLDLFGDGNSIDKDAQINLRKKLENACRPAEDVISPKPEEKKRGSIAPDEPAKSKPSFFDKYKTKENDKKNKSVEDEKTNNKRNASEVDTMPDWLRQKACLERRQQKRQRSAAVANWTIGDQNGKAGKGNGTNLSSTKSVHKSGSNAGSLVTSLGASHAIRRNRSAGAQASSSRGCSGAAVPSRKRNVAVGGRRGRQVGKSKKPATSFKGLLSLLGQQAEKGTQ